MRAVQAPIVLSMALDGLTVAGNPLGYQISLTQGAEFLSISPGLCALGVVGTNPAAVFNTQLGMRIYAENVVPADGAWHQGGKPQGRAAFTAILSGALVIPWQKSLTVYLEVFTIYAGPLPSGSSLEFAITPFTGG